MRERKRERERERERDRESEWAREGESEWARERRAWSIYREKNENIKIVKIDRKMYYIYIYRYRENHLKKGKGNFVIIDWKKNS